MAHRMLKGYSFLLYFLAILTCFFVGVTFAGIVEAGKNQGLAGGAIVLGYGVIVAFFGLLMSVFIASKANRKIIFRLNIILAIFIVCFYGYYHIKYLERQKQKYEQRKEQIRKTPKQALEQVSEPTAMLNSDVLNNPLCKVSRL